MCGPKCLALNKKEGIQIKIAKIRMLWWMQYGVRIEL